MALASLSYMYTPTSSSRLPIGHMYNLSRWPMMGWAYLLQAWGPLPCDGDGSNRRGARRLAEYMYMYQYT